MDISLLNNESNTAISNVQFIHSSLLDPMEIKEQDVVSPRPKRDAAKKDKKRKSSTKETESFIPTVVSKFNPSLSKRQLELEAYAAVIASFRANGELTWKKETVLQDLRAILKISDERHRMELKQAEDALTALNFPINRKGKQSTTNEGYDSESPSSDVESNSEDQDESKRKRQKNSNSEKTQRTEYQYGTFALPNSETQPASVAKVPNKKKKESKKKVKIPEISLQQTDSSDPRLKSNDIATPLPFENIPPDVLEAKETGDLEKLKLVLQKHQDQVRAELAALNNGAQT